MNPKERGTEEVDKMQVVSFRGQLGFVVNKEFLKQFQPPLATEGFMFP
jgi:hypothetical protein